MQSNILQRSSDCIKRSLVESQEEEKTIGKHNLHVGTKVMKSNKYVKRVTKRDLPKKKKKSRRNWWYLDIRRKGEMFQRKRLDVCEVRLDMRLEFSRRFWCQSNSTSLHRMPPDYFSMNKFNGRKDWRFKPISSSSSIMYNLVLSIYLSIDIDRGRCADQ